MSRRGLTGQVTVTSEAKPYRIAFARGAVVGATSPLASDAAVRLALTGGLVSSTQVADITRRVAASPHRDEIEVIAEAARLAADQAQKLRRRLVAQRAARTFSLDKGDFVIEDAITIPVVPGSELDVRTVIHMGARNNLAEVRLAQELALFGAWFKLLPDAIPDLSQFGFTETDKPVLQELIGGANLADIEGDHPEVGERGVRAIVYALAAYGACEVAAKPVPTNRPKKTSSPPISQARTVTNPNQARRTPSGMQPIADEQGVPRRVDTRGSGPANRIETPDGMSLRSPPASSQPPVRQTPATGSTVVPRTSTPTAHPGFDTPRTPTPTNHPAFDRPGSGASAPAFDRTRSATVPPRTPPAVSRTQTPVEPAISRAPTTPFAGRTPTDPSTGRTPTDPVAARAPTNRTSSPTPQHPAVTRAPSPQEPAVGRAPSPTGPVTARTMTPLRPLPASGPTISRTTSQSRASVLPAGPPVRPSSSAIPRPNRPSSPMPVRSRTNTAAALETDALIRDRLALVDRGADHFVLLGISQDATPDLIRAAYFTLARKLHPDRIASLGIIDSARDAQRLFAQINAAFAVLNDTLKRTEYLSIVARGGESAVRAEEAKADELAMRVMHAEEAFRRGEMALRREQLAQAITEFTTAVELQPQEPEYQALFTWAKFAAAGDKQAIAHKTRNELARAAEKSTQSPTARFYLGRVERILGREREALEHFYEVLRIKANHAEASSEIRVLETRLKKR
ncbi:MAG: DnaJ domain-containing protein [Deltaproteobacteria bacterium]